MNKTLRKEDGYLLIELLILIFVTTLLFNVIGGGMATLVKATVKRSSRLEQQNELDKERVEKLPFFFEKE